jgi:hypothetical protein
MMTYGPGLGVVSQTVAKLVARGDVREVATSATVPRLSGAFGNPFGADTIRVVTEDELKKEFARWYEKWWVWALIGVGTVGAGTGVYFWVRSRR